jgi:uroporphyrinogen III methyltransferase/synthase
MAEQTGKVYLVGAGPGDATWLTVRAQQLLTQAEVLVYDALVDSDLLSLVPETCVKLDVGKRGGQPSIPQTEINQLLVQHCQQGRQIVRLKSGDPFIFGRVQAEIEALTAAHCAFEVVPGLSSALVAPLLAGIPLTDPVFSRCFAVLTAHDPDALDWRSLAQLDTLVILMGGRNLPEILNRLRQHNRSPQTPISIIRWAGRPQQQIWEGTLANILMKITGISCSPCVIVIGEVVRLRHYWQPNREAIEPDVNGISISSSFDIAMSSSLSSMTGKTILVTRAATQSSQFTTCLQQEGATVIEMPTLEIVPPSSWQELDAAIAQLEQFDWLILTSANAVEFFLDRLATQLQDHRTLAGLRIAVVGEKTAAVLQKRGLQPDFVPPEYVADSLAAHFPGSLVGANILFPRVESGGRDVLVKDLTSRGAVVTEVAAYQSRCPDAIAPKVLSALQTQAVDAITFASSKTVKHFCQLLQQSQGDESWKSWLQGSCIASIGPQTSKTCQELLGRVDVEAEEHTLEGLTQAIAHWFAPHDSV